jgi:predicted transglutaminase-like cysteine proteinase
VQCESIRGIRQFLAGCKYISDTDLFDKEEYWQPPEEFEQRKKGDCEDRAFGTWRQLNISEMAIVFQ